MSDRPSVRALTAGEIAAIVVATSNVEERETEYMDSRIFDLSQRAKADGDETLSATYYFLSSVLRPRVEALVNIDSSTNQFWVRPCSLTPDELELLRQVVDSITDPEVRSRFADYVWMKTRDHVFGEIAIDDYLESAYRLRDPAKWPGSAARYERAVKVAAALGKKNERYRRAIAIVEQYLAQLDGTDPLFLSERLMTILLDQKEGDRSRNADLATKCAEAAEGRGNFYLALHYWDLAIRWCIALTDPAREKTARISAAESVVKDAESRVSGDAPSFLVAAGLLQHAIAMLQKAGAPKERIEEVEMKLREYGALGVEELKPIGSKFDASDIIAAARAAVIGKSLQEVIHAIADMIILPNRNAVRRSVLDRAKKYPFSHMFPEVRVNSAGLTTAGRGSVNGDETGESRNVLALMYQDVVQSLSIEAQARIAPAWREVQDEQTVREGDMAIVARQSWFVPPSRESFFAKGLAAGFNGDLITATHILALQIEPAIRWNLQRRGVATLKLNREGHYEERDLNQLLAMPESKELLGENLHFTLTAILTSRFGDNLRNDLAHGLVEPNRFYSPISLYFWAVCLCICVKTGEIAPPSSASDPTD